MKKPIFAVIIAIMCLLTACTSINYSASFAGASDYATVAVKDFVTMGIVTVYATEIHHCSPFGFKQTIEGSKITYADLMQEAAKLEADDIINVRIDTNINYRKGAFDWLTGWTRTYNHTGTALAIKYANMQSEPATSDPQLRGLPKEPESTGATKSLAK